MISARTIQEEGYDRIEELLVATAERMDLQTLDRNDDGSWALHFPDGDLIEVQYDPDRRQVTLFSELATP